MPEVNKEEAILLHGVRFDLSDVDDASFKYLCRYVNEPYRNYGGPASGEWKISIRTVRDFHAARDKLLGGTRPKGALETYAGVFHDVFEAGGDTELFAPSTFDGYVIAKHGHNLDITMNLGYVERERIVLRLVREIAYRAVENAGGYAFHAASVAAGSYGGVLITGEPGAGKTSLMLTLLARMGGSFVCNDRTLIFGKEDNLFAGYLPLAIRVGVGACRRWSDLQQYLKRGRSLRRVIGEASGSTSKIEIEPYELSSMLGVERASRVTIKRIIVPRLLHARKAPQLSLLHPSDARPVLENQCYSGVDPLWPEPWVEVWRAPLRREVIINAIITHFPVFELTFGANETFGQRLAAEAVQDA